MTATDHAPIQPSGLLPATVLLLLKEQPGHGYELVERVKAFGVSRSQRAVYAAASMLEDEGLLKATFDFPARGPARRVLEVTPAGDEALARFADGVTRLDSLLDQVLDRRRALLEEDAPAEADTARQGRRRRRNPAA